MDLLTQVKRKLEQNNIPAYNETEAMFSTLLYLSLNENVYLQVYETMIMLVVKSCKRRVIATEIKIDDIFSKYET